MKILILLFLISQELLAQALPESYKLNGNALKKHNADSPSGNDIGFIIASGDTVLLSTGVGVSRSTDRGENWTNFFNFTPSDNIWPSALAYSNGVIWTAFQTEEEQLGEMQPAGRGLQYSTDMGNNWNQIPQPVEEKTDTLISYGNNRLKIIPVHTKVGNIVFDIAVINNHIWIASWLAGLKKSSDMGKTWQKVILPPDTLDGISPEDSLKFIVNPNDLNEAVFSIAVVDSLTFYVGTAGGINKTTDAGKSWRKFNHLNQQKPISGNWAPYLNYNGLTKTLFASTWRAMGSTEFYALSFTSDGGESWKTSLDGEKVCVTGFKGEDVIAPTVNGVYRSSNMGETWVKPGQIKDERSGLSIMTNAFFSAASEGDDIWLGTSSGLVRLTEKNSMWNGTWRIFMASQPVQSKSSSYAFPNPFSPDAGKIAIKYTTGAQRTNVTIRIFDFGMNLVRTVIQNEERGSLTGNGSLQDGGTLDYWDGRNENGSIVPNGVYFYRIDFGSGEPSFGKIIVLM